MSKINRCYLLSNMLVIVLALCRMASAGEADSQKEVFLNLLEHLQRKTKNVEWRVNSELFKIDPDTGELKETPYWSHARAVMDGEPGNRMRTELYFAGRWYDGQEHPEPSFWSEQLAYNGAFATGIRRRATAEKEGDPLHQNISADRPSVESFVEMGGLYIISQYYRDTGLAQYFSSLEDADWELERTEGDTYILREHVSEIGKREITVDLSKGGAITEMKFILAGAVTGHFHNIVLKEHSDGIWLPVSADFLDYIGPREQYIRKLTFEHMAVNQDISDDEFVIEFEPGHQVYDKTTGKKFTAGYESDTGLLVDIDDALSDVEVVAVENEDGGQEGAQEVAKRAPLPESGQAESVDRSQKKGWPTAAWLLGLALLGTIGFLVARRIRK